MAKGRFVSYLVAGFLFVAAVAGAAPDAGSGERAAIFPYLIGGEIADIRFPFGDELFGERV